MGQENYQTVCLAQCKQNPDNRSQNAKDQTMTNQGAAILRSVRIRMT